MEIARPQTAEHSAVAEFIAELNAQPEQQIGFFGEGADQILHSLIEDGVLDNALTARRNGAIVGFIGREIDTELDRAWIFGPVVSDPQWEDVADRLWAGLHQIVTVPVRTLELFFNLANVNVGQWAERRGFEHYKDVYLVRCDGPAASQQQPDVKDVDDDHRDELIELHDSLFPNTYYSGRQLLERLDSTKRCLVITEGDRLAGYAYVEVEPRFGEAQIHFLGVTEQGRRKGTGTKLVRSAVDWMFSFDNVKETWLTVDDHNRAARRLYQRLGWAEVHHMRAMRLTRKEAPQP